MKRFFVIGLIVLLMIGVSACSPSTPSDQIVSKTFDALKSADKETASKYIDYDKILSNANISEGYTNETKYDVAKAVLKNLNYKIISTSSGINSETVKAEITNINMVPIIREYVNANFSLMQSKTKTSAPQSLNQSLLDLINSKDNKTVTKAVNITLEKNNDTWKIKLTDDLLDAILGGAPSFINSVNQSMASSFSK